ncbi:hypothetical protein WJX74_006941 [Apatococcus lobatus]|uniref:OPA3-like protein n=2 Tax=Apatococcus TaxID=904362 RepID=A0AAW1SFS4_9CHLO
MPPGSNPKPQVPAGKRPFWADFTDAMSRSSSNAGQQLNNTWKNATSGKGGGFKFPKWEMPVKVEMDFLNPFMQSCKKTANDIWVQLPPPVQAGMPFFAVGAASGILVYSIEEHRLKHQRGKAERFENKNETLIVEREELHERIRDLKSRSSAPRSASEMRMAAAVAESTTAAAEAAKAAAQAAMLCAHPPRVPSSPTSSGSRARRRYRGSDDDNENTIDAYPLEQQQREPNISIADTSSQAGDTGSQQQQS